MLFHTYHAGLLYDTYDNFQYNQLLDSLQVLQDDALVPHLSPRSAMVADGPGAAPHDAPSFDGIDGFDILGLDALTGGSLVFFCDFYVSHRRG